MNAAPPNEGGGTAPSGGALPKRIPWVLAVFAVSIAALFLLSGVPSSLGGLPMASAPHRLVGSPVASPIAVPTSHSSSPLGSPTLSIPSAAGSYTKSVTGGFWGTTNVSWPSTTPVSCAVPLTKGACTGPGSLTPYINSSNDIALNLTSTGMLAMAYTAYTTTGPCASSTYGNTPAYTLSAVGFRSSSNNGGTWSAPTYLGNTVCSTVNTQNKYPSSWQPALTSLPNGTIVMVYVQYNATAPGFAPFFSQTSPPLSRLVFTQLYPTATQWTPAVVLNVSNPDPSLTVSFPPARPSITSFGKTIYVTWMSLGNPSFPPVLTHVGMRVSTTAGNSWSPTLTLGSATVNSANPFVLVNPKGRLFVAYATNVFQYGTGGSANVVVDTSTVNGTGMTTSTVAYGVGLNATFGEFYNPAPRLAYSTKFLPWTLDIAYIGGRYAQGGQVAGLYFSHSTTNGSSFIPSYTVPSGFNPSVTYAQNGSASRLQDIAMTPTFGKNVVLEATMFNGTACVAGSCGVEQTIAMNTSNNGTTWTGPTILSGWNVPNGTNGSWRPYLVGEYEAAISYGSTTLLVWTNTSCPSLKAHPKTGQCGTNSGGFQYGNVSVSISQAYTGATISETWSPVGLPGLAIWNLDVMGNVFTANGSTNITVSNVPTSEPIFFNVTGPGLYNASSVYLWGSSSVASPARFTVSGSMKETFIEFVPLTVTLNPSYLAGQNCNSGYCSPGYFAPPSSWDWINANGRYFYYFGCVGYADSFAPYEYGGYIDGMNCANAFASHYASQLSYNTATWVQVGKPYALNVTYWSPMNALCGQGSISIPAGYSYFVEECSAIYIAELTVASWFGFGQGNTTSTSTNITVTPLGPVTEQLNFVANGVCSGGFAYGEIFGTYKYQYNGTSCSSVGGGGSSITVPVTFNETGLPSGVAWGLTLTRGTSIFNGSTSTSSVTISKIPIGVAYTISINTVPNPKTGLYWVGTTPSPTVTAPDFAGVWVKFAQRSLVGLNFATTVGQTGLSNGTGWSFTLWNKTSNTNTSYAFPTGSVPGQTTPLTLAGGASYAINGSFVYGSNGTSYYVSAINISVASTNSTPTQTPPQSTVLKPVGITALTIVYSPMYWLAVIADAGGVVTPSSHWVTSGSSVKLTATANTGYTFASWTGIGNGSSGTKGTNALTITIRPGGPVTEVADFRVTAAPTFAITVQASGIASGENYSLKIDSQTYTGTAGSGTFIVSNITMGTHTISAPYVYSSPVANTLWIPTSITTSYGSPPTISVTSPGIVTIAYSTEYLLTVTSTTGGTVSGGSGGPWFASGATTSLTATPLAGWKFVGWNGTGPGGQTATTAAITVTMNGPVYEVAEFVKLPPKAPATYYLSVGQQGLPTGIGWNVSLGTNGLTGTNRSLNLTGLNGSYTLTVPTVYGAPGVRYVPNSNGVFKVTVKQNSTQAVTFTTQYLVTVSVTGAGVATPSGAWFNSSSTVNLVATANASWAFVSWNGTQSSATAALTLTVTGPVSETATFAPVYPHHQTVNTLQGAPVAIGLLVVLLIVGLAIAFLVVRRRGGSVTGTGPAESEQGEAPTEAAPMEETYLPPNDQ